MKTFRYVSVVSILLFYTVPAFCYVDTANNLEFTPPKAWQISKFGLNCIKMTHSDGTEIAITRTDAEKTRNLKNIISVDLATSLCRYLEEYGYKHGLDLALTYANATKITGLDASECMFEGSFAKRYIIMTVYQYETYAIMYTAHRELYDSHFDELLSCVRSFKIHKSLSNRLKGLLK